MKERRLVLFSEKSKFDLFASVRIQHCCRRFWAGCMEKNAKIMGTYGGGNSVPPGYIISTCVGQLHRLNNGLDAPKCWIILKEFLTGTVHNKFLSSHKTIPWLNNDCKCASGLMEAWFNDHHVLLLLWLSSSPDLNIIKHVWEGLVYHLCHRYRLPCNSEELWVAL